jgi:WD40 repeat protein
MRRIRFTIGGLLAVVLFLAVAIAALREATDLWDSGVFTMTAGLLVVAVLLVIHGTGPMRAFWLGFALSGGCYLVASLIPPVESRLLTTKGLAFVDSKIPGRSGVFRFTLRAPNSTATRAAIRAFAFSPDGRTLASASNGSVRLWDAATGMLVAGPGGTSENFVRIGHSLLALVLAYAGGRFSRWLFGRREQGTRAPSVSTSEAT